MHMHIPKYILIQFEYNTGDVVSVRLRGTAILDQVVHNQYSGYGWFKRWSHLCRVLMAMDALLVAEIIDNIYNAAISVNAHIPSSRSLAATTQITRPISEDFYTRRATEVLIVQERPSQTTRGKMAAQSTRSMRLSWTGNATLSKTLRFPELRCE